MNHEMLKRAVCGSVDAHSARCTDVSDYIWEHPEVNFHEDLSAAALRVLLEENGFSVTDRLGGMPNAFRAEYGSGRPVI
ncbi:MAG: amidohydrolase, partial [Clostridia bacterium]|nr:amidohydrolase [Clostridia bacterium]